MHDFGRLSVAFEQLGTDGRVPALHLVVGGFAEMSPAGLTILADQATPRDEFDTTMLASEIKDAEEDVTDAKDDAQRDNLKRYLEQLRSLQAALGTQRPEGAH